MALDERTNIHTSTAEARGSVLTTTWDGTFGWDARTNIFLVILLPIFHTATKHIACAFDDAEEYVPVVVIIVGQLGRPLPLLFGAVIPNGAARECRASAKTEHAYREKRAESTTH